MVYGMQNKLESGWRGCVGSTAESPELVQNCWCDDSGKEGQLLPLQRSRIAKECGYSLRHSGSTLADGTDAAKVGPAVHARQDFTGPMVGVRCCLLRIASCRRSSGTRAPFFYEEDAPWNWKLRWRNYLLKRLQKLSFGQGGLPMPRTPHPL